MPSIWELDEWVPDLGHVQCQVQGCRENGTWRNWMLVHNFDHGDRSTPAWRCDEHVKEVQNAGN